MTSFVFPYNYIYIDSNIHIKSSNFSNSFIIFIIFYSFHLFIYFYYYPYIIGWNIFHNTLQIDQTGWKSNNNFAKLFDH